MCSTDTGSHTPLTKSVISRLRTASGAVIVRNLSPRTSWPVGRPRRKYEAARSALQNPEQRQPLLGPDHADRGVLRQPCRPTPEDAAINPRYRPERAARDPAPELPCDGRPRDDRQPRPPVIVAGAFPGVLEL